MDIKRRLKIFSSLSVFISPPINEIFCTSELQISHEELHHNISYLNNTHFKNLLNRSNDLPQKKYAGQNSQSFDSSPEWKATATCFGSLNLYLGRVFSRHYYLRKNSSLGRIQIRWRLFGLSLHLQTSNFLIKIK